MIPKRPNIGNIGLRKKVYDTTRCETRAFAAVVVFEAAARHDKRRPLRRIQSDANPKVGWAHEAGREDHGSDKGATKEEGKK